MDKISYYNSDSGSYSDEESESVQSPDEHQYEQLLQHNQLTAAAPVATDKAEVSNSETDSEQDQSSSGDVNMRESSVEIPLEPSVVA